MLYYLLLRRCRSGQSEETVNLSPYGLRRFESYPAHKKKTPLNLGGVFDCEVGFEKRSALARVGVAASP